MALRFRSRFLKVFRFRSRLFGEIYISADNDLLTNALAIVAGHVDPSTWKNCYWFCVVDTIVYVLDCDAFWKPVKLDSSPVEILFQISCGICECLISA